VEACNRKHSNCLITRIELQSGAGVAWLGVGLYSPSNGAILCVQMEVARGNDYCRFGFDNRIGFLGTFSAGVFLPR
jgi:hypothetical protein